MVSPPIRAIARLIDHALLHPTLTDIELRAGCELALAYDVASVCIKPYAVPLASQLLAGSNVAVGTVIGFPHGSNSTSLKVAEALQVCRDGAVELDMVVNLGKVLTEDWAYVMNEIRIIQDVCQSQGAILKVIFENDFLPADSVKIRLCEICTTVGVAFVKTSTGFGFIKDRDGKYDYKGATEHDLRLMLNHVGPGVRVKAAGGIRTFTELQSVQALGVTRVGTSSTASIMSEAYQQFGVILPNKSALSVTEANGY